MATFSGIGRPRPPFMGFWNAAAEDIRPPCGHKENGSSGNRLLFLGNVAIFQGVMAAVFEKPIKWPFLASKRGWFLKVFRCKMLIINTYRKKFTYVDFFLNSSSFLAPG